MATIGQPKKIKTSKWNTENVIEFVSNNSCSIFISEEYVNCDSLYCFKCECGKIYNASFSNFKNRNQRQCIDCSKKTRANKMVKPYMEVKNDMENNNCLLITKECDYKGTNKKITIKCRCGNIFECSYNTARHYRKYQCNHCSKKARLSIEDVKLILKEVAEGYTLLTTEYTGVMNKMKFKCPMGHFFYKNWSHFYNDGERCPTCLSSKGENKIARFLVDGGIDYQPEYSFSDCKRIKKLNFDFAIFGDNKKIKLLIEYDGEHHFKPVGFGEKNTDKSLKKYKEQVECDKIKNSYCKAKNIKLIRIPYWHFDKIKNILIDNNVIVGGVA
jgi:hypothetical protein